MARRNLKANRNSSRGASSAPGSNGKGADNCKSSSCGGQQQADHKLCGFLLAVVAPDCNFYSLSSTPSCRLSELSSSAMPPDCDSRHDCGDLLQCRSDGEENANAFSDCGGTSLSCENFDCSGDSPSGKMNNSGFCQLIGADCCITGQGANVCILVDGRISLYPISSAALEDSVLTEATPASKRRSYSLSSSDFLSSGVSCSDQTNATPSSAPLITSNAGDSTGALGKRRRGGTSPSTPSIVTQLQKLTVRNGLHIAGRVVKVVQKANAVRVVVIFDVWFPSALCSTLHYWKAGPISAFAMSHLSCDWQHRRGILNASDLINDRNVWNLPECHVLGCSLHASVPSSSKKAKFDLHEIFRCLSACDPEKSCYGTSIMAADKRHHSRGFWDLPDEILMSIFSRLLPKDLLNVASICRHTRSLARSIIPCMKLRLFPHQKAAVEWMLRRERNPQVFSNPMYKDLQTEDDFHFYLNCVTGEVSLELPPDLKDFRGGFFCDEPGLGKTITALSLVLKSQGTFSEPPEDVDVCWCEGQSGERLGYYEVSATTGFQGMSTLKRCVAMKTRRYQSPLVDSPSSSNEYKKLKLIEAESSPCSSNTRRKLVDTYEKVMISTDDSVEDFTNGAKEGSSASLEIDLVWVECDACSKWRKLVKGCKPPREGTAWFCRMNIDPLYQSCSAPQEVWDSKERIHSMEGFYKSNSEPGLEQNISFFTSVLKERANLLVSETKKTLSWLAGLSPVQLAQMASQGIAVPQHLRMASVSGSTEHHYEKFFEAFGLAPKHDKKKVIRWHYPSGLKGFHFDTVALKCALANPVEEMARIYLSKATLIVVPANLVEHWKTQIERHTTDKQLRFCICIDPKNTPMPHNLAWDYDIVITTFNRLSAEWSSRESSVLMQIHWFRIILDEGHTLGASLTLTNKLQMAINMHASRRWVLTGTPTPDTPNSQLAHLQPMLRFLHDELYGCHFKMWDAAILRPFEAQLEEGRLRLFHLLQRCMISSRKADLCSIPACIRKVKLLEFTEKHAASYNELVETVRRNILMADWNDPDHVESLLNPKQWKLKSSTVKNVRLSCCVAGQIKVRNANEDIQETMDMVVQQGIDPTSKEYSAIRNSFLFGGNCLRCGEWCRLPILTPCFHFLCLSCVSLDSERCSLPTCGHAYKMQKPKARPENPNPKWPVPQDLIELQPSYIQEDWHPEWQATSSSKVAYLIKQLKLLHDANKELLLLQDSEEHHTQLPQKVIVFSQFLEHISVTELQLTKAGIQHAGMYSPMHWINKMKSLKTFQDDPKCLVLLMDGSSALGLDLSFVTHVYLMEPIWDRSIEEQVVSRAHRMGATRPVLVETLAMCGTIEEQMLNFLQRSTDANQCRTHHDPAETRYLANLSFVRKQQKA